MAKPRRIKGKSGKQGSLVKSQEPVNYDENPPIFWLFPISWGNHYM